MVASPMTPLNAQPAMDGPARASYTKNPLAGLPGMLNASQRALSRHGSTASTSSDTVTSSVLRGHRRNSQQVGVEVRCCRRHGLPCDATSSDTLPDGAVSGKAQAVQVSGIDT